MRSFLLGTALFAAAFASTAATAGEPTRRFTRDGETYAYTISAKGNRVVLTGICETTGASFELIVRGDRVSGVAAGVPVSFRVAEAQATLSGGIAELASR